MAVCDKEKERLGHFTSHFLSALSPMFHFLRPFGLASFDQHLQPSYPWTLHAVCLMLLTAFSLTLQVAGTLRSTGPAHEVSSVVVLFAVSGFSVWVAIGSSIAMRNSVVKICKKFVEVDMVLYKGNPVYDKIGVALRKVVLLISTPLASMAAVDFVFVYYAQYGLWMFFVRIVFLTNLAAPAPFAATVFLLYKKLQAMNMLLGNYKRTSKIAVENKADMIQHLETSQERSDLFNIDLFPKQNHSIDKPLKLIQSLREAHIKLFEINETVIRAFGLSILALTLNCLVVVVSFSYMIIQNLAAPANAEMSITAFVFEVGWVLGTSAGLIFTSLSCELATREALRTSYVLHKRMLYDSSSGCAVKRELFEFAQQVADCRIVMTAAGLFEINNTLLLSVAATVATYLIVLLSVKNN